MFRELRQQWVPLLLSRLFSAPPPKTRDFWEKLKVHATRWPRYTTNKTCFQRCNGVSTVQWCSKGTMVFQRYNDVPTVGGVPTVQRCSNGTMVFQRYSYVLTAQWWSNGTTVFQRSNDVPTVQWYSNGTMAKKCYYTPVLYRRGCCALS